MRFLVEVVVEILALLGIWLGLSFWCYATYPDPAWWEGSIVGLVAFVAILARMLWALFAGLR